MRCTHDHTHQELDFHSKKCLQCSGSLEKFCEGCKKFSNYSNFNVHKKACSQRLLEAAARAAEVEAAVSVRKIRFAFFASVWSFEDEDEQKGTLGQFCEELPADFPKGIRRMNIADPSAESSFVDVYDAIWGSIALDPKFELVHIFHSLSSIIEATNLGEMCLDLLVVGDWIYPSVFASENRESAEEIYKTLQNMELELRLRVFPPVEYAWYFAQKAHFLTRLGRFPLSPSVKVIPTFVVPSGHRWKPQVLEFAKKNNAKIIMMKRELSDGGNHVLKMDTNSLEHLKGRHEFRWIAQPFLLEFSELPEMRMYVIDGKCTFGCMTRFVDRADGSRHMSTVATTPGRRTWLKEGGQEAAAAAEHVAQIIARDQAHALRFLRVDLIRRNDGSGGWWLNELEYFGNAHILLEVFDHASELLDLIVAATKKWIQEAVLNV